GESPEIKWQVEVAPGRLPGMPSRKIETLHYELALVPYGFSSNFRVDRELFRNFTSTRQKTGFKYFERDAREAIIFDSDGEVKTRLSKQLDETQTLLSQTSVLFSVPDTLSFYAYMK